MQILNCTINRLHPILVHQNINATPCFWTSKISFQLIFANLALVFTCSSTPETVWHLVARETKFTIKKKTHPSIIYIKKEKSLEKQEVRVIEVGIKTLGEPWCLCGEEETASFPQRLALAHYAAALWWMFSTDGTTEMNYSWRAFTL